MFCASLGVDSASLFVNWLPLFHDMGLVGHLLAAIYAGACCVTMPPLSFLQRPERWLSAIGRYRATHSGAPNFAFELCARRAPQMRLEGVALGCWQAAFCGAETIRPATMRRFAETFASAGFRARALTPAYGLAEATLFVSASSKGDGVKIGVPFGRDGQVAVSCGRPAAGQSVMIVDPLTREPAAEGCSGEIWLAGAHVASGYWRDPDATRAMFGATLAASSAGPFLRTGDLGHLCEGELTVTGRLKELIVHHGLNIHPAQIEATVMNSHSGLGAAGAAFSIEVGDSEEVVVVQEMSRALLRRGDEGAIAKAALRAVAEAHAIRLYDFILASPGAIPRTTSGKIRRGDCRHLYLTGALDRIMWRQAPSVRGPPDGAA
jgi:acyl-CoA synthetase (AMP-forming)/AMP-acid ligase II